MIVTNESKLTNRLHWNAQTIVGFCLVTFIYFADVVLKAIHKCFWFDEFFTVFLCRLPNFFSTWSAVKHGADFNPPLFYLLTRGAEWLFGEGLIATRLPAMLGVWLFGVSLFLFVGRRAGAISGAIAGLFPFFTLAQYYSYEARAHGIVLGWCGLAIVCWQRDRERRGKYLSLCGFGLSLLAGLVTHVYAVYLILPFLLVETFDFFTKKRIDWPRVAVILVTFGFSAVFIYLPLSRVYRAKIPPAVFLSSHDMLQRFFVNTLGPALVVLLVMLVFTANDSFGKAHRSEPTIIFCRQEWVLAVGFICIPIVGFCGSRFSHGPFFDRYFLSTVSGVAMLLGLVSSGQKLSSWVPKALAGVMFVLMVGDFFSTLYLSAVKRLVLYEPSTGIRLATTPSEPMALHAALLDTGNLDILVLRSLDFLYLAGYAPPSLATHLYYGSPSDEVNRGGLERLASGAKVTLKTTSVQQFLDVHQHFLVYQTADTLPGAFASIAEAGYRLRSARSDVSGILFEFEK